MALRAEFKFETDVFFMILLRKIMKNTSVSKEYSAAEGGKNLFTQQCSDCIRLANKEKKTNFVRPVAIDLVWSLAIRFRYTT